MKIFYGSREFRPLLSGRGYITIGGFVPILPSRTSLQESLATKQFAAEKPCLRESQNESVYCFRSMAHTRFQSLCDRSTVLFSNTISVLSSRNLYCINLVVQNPHVSAKH